MATYMSLKNKKRIIVIVIACSIVFVALILQLVNVQIVKYDYYSQLAYSQQTRERTVEAKRGTIYDSTGKKVLAQSITTNTIKAVPTGIDNDKKEEISKKLAEILDISEETILNKLKKTTASVELASKVDDEKAKKVLEYLNENNITGISIDEDTKRVYPYGTLLSQVLGFVGTDNQGLNGIEAYYDESLAGINGKIVGSTDGKGRETPFTNEQYVEAVNGKDLVLTVDATIQSIVEKYLSQAVNDNSCEYGTAVVLNPKTGEVIAMATYPTYDANDPFTINSESLKANWDTYSTEEKNSYLQAMWRNKAISDTAEPGSTFKIVTAAAALEENITKMDTPGVFNCTGTMLVDTWKIKCWRYYNPHGSESLRQGIMNSCNPVFMQVGLKIGVKDYVKYLKAFNLYSRTGIDLPGEAFGIMHDENAMTNVDLATTSFGQTISITTLQTAVNYAVIANGGYLVQPYVVKEIKNADGNYDQVTESKVLKQIISTETANSVLSALESTVTEGTGKGAKVNGYRVAGKTATGEQGRGENTKYLAGFAAIAPVDDPQLVIAFNLYNPVGEAGYGGATLCAPAVGSIIDESLRYLNVEPDYTLQENTISETVIPSVSGKTYEEAQKILEEKGFKIAKGNEFSNDSVVVEQIPKSGASLMSDSVVYVYSNSTDAKQSTTIKDVRNLNMQTAIKSLQSQGINVRIMGEGYVLSQDPSPGSTLDKGSIVTLKCIDTTELP